MANGLERLIRNNLGQITGLNNTCYTYKQNMAGIIYCIEQKSTSKIYIGLTADYIRRKSEHLYELKHNKHCNQHLQNAWNKYGESDFSFNMLKEIDGTQEDLKQAEITLIEELDATNKVKGFNISKGGDTSKWRAINQYTKDGIFVQKHDTMSIAAAKLGKLSTPIWKALNKKIPSAHGYQWRYCDEDQNIRTMIANHDYRGVVQQFDIQDNLIAEYENAMDAGKAIQHMTNSKSYKSVAINIRKVCYNQMKQYQKFIWKFKK